jgi:hypothetical protein
MAYVPQLCPGPKVPQRGPTRRCIVSCWLKGLSGGRTRARTWDPMIKSHRAYAKLASQAADVTVPPLVIAKMYSGMYACDILRNERQQIKFY